MPADSPSGPGTAGPAGPPTAPEPKPERISLKEGIALAGSKPDNKLMRKDLLVKGGWLHPVWEWSHDVGVSLDQAILNCKKLGEEFKLVGEPQKPVKVKGRKEKPEKEKEPMKVKPIPRQPKPSKGGFSFTKRNSSAFKSGSRELRLPDGEEKGLLARLEAMLKAFPRLVRNLGDLGQSSRTVVRRLQVAWVISFVAALLAFLLYGVALASSLLLAVDLTLGATVLVLSLTASRSRAETGRGGQNHPRRALLPP